MRSLQQALTATLLFVIATPGLILWSPVWVYIKRRERSLLAKGPRWNDSIAEMKMMVCGLLGMAVMILVGVLTVTCMSIYPAALLYYMYFTMRCYEEGIADARSV